MCWLNGYHEVPVEQWERQDDKEVLADGVAVVRSEIPGLLNSEEFTVAIREWHEFKVYGYPYDGGRKDQPCQWFDVIQLFDGLADKHGRQNGGN